MTIPFFRSRTPKEWLLVKKNILKIIIGQNITQGPSKQYSMAPRVLEGNILARFDAKAAELGNKNNANFNNCLDRVIAYNWHAHFKFNNVFCNVTCRRSPTAQSVSLALAYMSLTPTYYLISLQEVLTSSYTLTTFWRSLNSPC